MATFTLLECDYCEGKCEKTFDKSPLDEIMKQQDLIFDGFMRLQVFNHLSQQFVQLIPSDVINLCMEFFKIDIISSFTYEMDAICSLTETLAANGEHFLAYKISQILLAIHPEQSGMRCIVGGVFSGVFKMKQKQHLKRQQN